MSITAQSPQTPIKRPDWESRTNSPPFDPTGNRQRAIAGRARHRYAQGYQAANVRKASDFVQKATACSSVALNGSVNHDGNALACAAENVARWKTYLSEECVRAMMNAGWHWST
jgi:hypothetical protein